MAITAAPVAGKRKREDSSVPNSEAKRSAIHPKPKEGLKASKNSVPQPNGKSRNDVPAQPLSASVAMLETDTNAPKTSLPTVNPPYGVHHIQLVTGSYERVLHGVSARIPRSLLRSTLPEGMDGGTNNDQETITFSDTFLFAAHASSVRCLAISPSTEADKRYLATGSSDERINVYSISTAPPTDDQRVDLPTISSTSTAENPRNRSLGSLIHHDRAITRLEFPAKGKLFSAAEDNTIAISRTRDWTVLSSIKAPMPKPQGRPSGDTAGPGEVPAGVNDFAIHPSQKLMLSVSRGERCLRLWNLMTGKKAGVLNFDRSLLAQVGEGKYSSGEGRQVLWNNAGDAYVVGFEKVAAVFGIDSKPQALIKPVPGTKLHQFRMAWPVGDARKPELLAVSTEDGRILFFSMNITAAENRKDKLPFCTCVAQLGGPVAGVGGRIKDFEILEVQVDEAPAPPIRLVVTASSDGAIRMWSIKDQLSDLKEGQGEPQQIGSVVGTLETGNRITCLGAFVLDGKSDGKMVEEAEAGAIEEESESGSDAAE